MIPPKCQSAFAYPSSESSSPDNSSDTTGQTMPPETLTQRERMLNSLSCAAITLLSHKGETFADTMAEGVRHICGIADFDRLSILRNISKPDGLYLSKVYQWNGQHRNIAAIPDAPGDIPYREFFPYAEDILKTGNYISGLARLMPEAPWLERFGCLAILAMPIRSAGSFWGVVVFENLTEEKLFTSCEIDMLHSASFMLANVAVRNEEARLLESALSDAKEANSAKSSFLVQMSHEIRTPLNAVVGLSELALDAEQPDEETRDRLEKIHTSGMTILNIVNDILDLSKIESGKFEIDPANYDTSDLIQDIVALNIVRIGKKPIVFRLSVDENLPKTLYGDDLRVKQIFNNLLSNAFKYTQSGTVEWKLTFEQKEDQIFLISHVRDTGIGIKPEDQQKLFSDYNQVDAKINRQVEGTGLGLAITKKLLERMDGTISVVSKYGKGSTFSVRIRQSLAPGTTAVIGKETAENLMNLRHMLPKREKPSAVAYADLSYAHVLVVDDVSTNLDVIKGMMKPYRMKIDCAASGPQAIAMLRSGSPSYDAVFMDHMMPGMDGIETAQIIRKQIGTEYARHIPMIALTANAILGNEEMFLSQGFQAFLSKPIDMPKLDDILQRFVRDPSKEQNGKAVPLAEKDRPPVNTPLLLAIQGVDQEQALVRFHNNETFFINILRSYVSSTRKQLVNLRQFLLEENLKEYAIVIHGIKGASYSICAGTVGKMAENLESAAKAGNRETVMAGHTPFEEAAETLVRDIDEALKTAGAYTVKAYASSPDRTLLQELQEACRSFHMDRVDQVMERLESFRYQNGEDMILWLREQVNNMAFEKIFEIKFPAANAPFTEPLPFTAPDAKILIVDDDETSRNASFSLLSPLGMEIDRAGSGKEALAMIKKKQYHLILMDYLMPGRDGIAVTKSLRQMDGDYYRKIPVIALTAAEEPASRKLFLQAGMNDFASKPLMIEEITEKIRRWLPAVLILESNLPKKSPDYPEDLPEIYGIDTEGGIRYSGSPELWLRLLENFRLLIDAKSAKMEKDLQRGQIQNVTTEVHALKNAARMIGAKELAKGFARLEGYGNQKNISALKQEAPIVLKQYRAFKSLLHSFAPTAATDKKPASPEELMGLLHILQRALQHFHMDDADDAMKQLEERQIPGECLAQMETLREFMADVALEEALELVIQMIETLDQLS